jgi:hypothetical protein
MPHPLRLTLNCRILAALRSSLRIFLIVFAMLALLPHEAFAANQEPAGLNLGSTSFFDGFGRNEEGFTYLVYAQYATARSIMGNDGKALPYFTDPQIDVFVLVNQLAYTLPEKLFNDHAHLGINFILPFVAFDTSFIVRPPGVVDLTHTAPGLGDLTFGPFLQTRPIMAGGRPVFSQRFEFDVIAPTGNYDPYKDISQGAGFASLNPNWAATVLPVPHLEISARLNYLYNFKNNRPAIGSKLYGLSMPPPVKDSQAGQAGWLNFAASYEVLPSLHVGVNGYYFMQLNLDLYEMQDGSSGSGGGRGPASGERNFYDTGKASFLGIGPGLLWEADPHNKFFANLYFQTMVHNRAQSKVLNLHWIHGF